MATRDVKTSELPKADPVGVGPSEPYPEGSPPDPSAVVARVHPAQETTEAIHWQTQSEANLAAGGVIAGAEPITPPEPPEPPEEDNGGLRSKGAKKDDDIRIKSGPFGGKKPSGKGK